MSPSAYYVSSITTYYSLCVLIVEGTWYRAKTRAKVIAANSDANLELMSRQVWEFSVKGSNENLSGRHSVTTV